MTTPRIIRILQSTPLPCSCINEHANTRCNKPATVAYCEEASAGHWLVEPICRECWAKIAKETREE